VKDLTKDMMTAIVDSDGRTLFYTLHKDCGIRTLGKHKLYISNGLISILRTNQVEMVKSSS
jgi:hypothetical protein